MAAVLNHQANLPELYDAHASEVGRFLRYSGIPDADLDDALQEVFLVAHRRLSTFEPGTSGRAWLYTIARRVAANLRRKVERRREQSLEGGEATHDPIPRVQARQQALRLLGYLSAEKREAFLLYHLEGLTLREVSTVLEVPLQTVYSRLRVAQQELQGFLEGQRP